MRDIGEVTIKTGDRIGDDKIISIVKDLTEKAIEECIEYELSDD